MLNHLELENFRNHRKFELDFEKITAIIGPNGAGKSNILEAISVLSLCRSYREDDKRNLISFDADFARIKSGDLEVFIQQKPILLLKPKEKGVFKKQSDFIGRLKTIVFSPETISLVTGVPGQRRKFLDMMISQNDHEYLRTLMEYEKVRKERNALLQAIGEGRSKVTELSFWDGELVAKGELVTARRKEAAGYLNKLLPDLHQKISGGKESLQIQYLSNAGDDFKATLAGDRRREVAIGRTMVGPHRDDIVFELEGRNMANFASRGELRSAVLSLKIAELEFLSDNKEGVKPILLLDDVFSEFDARRRRQLGELIFNYQTVITTTDKDHLSKELLAEAKIVELSNQLDS